MSKSSLVALSVLMAFSANIAVADTCPSIGAVTALAKTNQDNWNNGYYPDALLAGKTWRVEAGGDMKYLAKPMQPGTVGTEFVTKPIVFDHHEVDLPWIGNVTIFGGNSVTCNYVPSGVDLELSLSVIQATKPAGDHWQKTQAGFKCDASNVSDCPFKF